MESISLQAILSVKDKMSGTLKQAANASGALGGSFKKTVGMGAAMQVGMSAVSRGLSAIAAHTGDAVRRYDQLNNFPRVLRNLGVSTKAADAATEKLKKGLDGLPTTLDTATMGVQRFTSVNKDVRKSTDYFLAMNNAILAGGAEPARQAAAVEQLSQAYARGKMDMMEWRALMEVMPGQLDQIAKAMGMTTTELGEGLRNGTVSMDDFMDTIVKLNKEGGGGLASFEKQARDAISGIGTAAANFGTKITAGIADVIGSIDKTLDDAGLPKIGEGITKAGGVVAKAFKGISKIVAGTVKGLTPYLKLLSMASGGAGKAVGGFGEALKKLAPILGFVTPPIILAAAAFKLFSHIKGFSKPIEGSTEIFKKNGKAANLAEKGAYKLKDGLGALAKMAGVAAIIASLALLAKSFEGLGSLGTDAIAPLLTFGVVVGGLAAVFNAFGSSLSANALGIIAFSASVSLMALAMAPIAQAGTEGAVAMGVFGAVVGILAVVFATFGQALNLAIPGMLVFAGVVLAAGAALALAAPFVRALTGLIKVLGQVIVDIIGASIPWLNMLGSVISSTMRTAGAVVSQVAGAMSNGFMIICNGVTTVINAISGGLVGILNAVSGIIQSIGMAALQAGMGFMFLAQGVAMLTGLPLGDMGASLAAAASGLAAIAATSGGLAVAGAAVTSLMAGITMGASSMLMFSMGMMLISASAAGLTAAITTLSATFAGLVITPPATGAFLAAFGSVRQAALTLVPALRAAGTRSGAGLVSGLSSGLGRAKTVAASSAAGIRATMASLGRGLSSVGRSSGTGYAGGLKGGLSKGVAHARTASSQIVSALKRAHSGATSAGRYIGQGLANGMRSMLGTVRSIAAQLAAAADKAIRAKAKIHSPSRVTRKSGRFIGEGLIVGIRDMLRRVKRNAEALISLPAAVGPALAMDMGGSLSAEYSYSESGSFYVEVPVMVDGREVSRATAPFMRDDLDRIDRRESRKRGVR